MAIKGYKTVVAPSTLVRELKRLLDRWREPRLTRVRADRVVPDVSNREHTGLSLDHIHFLATSMQTGGFRSRPAPGDYSERGRAKAHRELREPARRGPLGVAAESRFRKSRAGP